MNCLFAASTLLCGVILLQAQDAPTPAAAPQAAPQATPQATPGGRGAGAGRGRGARPPVVDTLGAGPWDLKSELGDIHVMVVTKGLDHPWGMAFLPDGDMLVTERPGRLRVIRKGVLDPMPIGPLPAIRAAVLGGLMDVALDPNFARNRLIYFVYSKPGAEEPAKATTAVARARWDGGFTLTDVKDIFVAEPWFGGRDAPKGCCGQGPTDASFGARMVFDKAGFLYVTLGDRNYGEKSQDPSVDWGKIVRLRDDGPFRRTIHS
jgi:glucose/arabinose dehydrogenase